MDGRGHVLALLRATAASGGALFALGFFRIPVASRRTVVAYLGAELANLARKTRIALAEAGTHLAHLRAVLAHLAKLLGAALLALAFARLAASLAFPASLDALLHLFRNRLGHENSSCI